MTEISAALVKELRDETGVGMMECKRALLEARGDKGKAIKLLRERGAAMAEKRATRTANQGIIASVILEEGRVGSLVEVNCETDFVARNETFKSFAGRLAVMAAGTDAELSVEAAHEIVAKIAEIGENIVVRRNIRYILQGAGAIVSYIHHGSMLGVLCEIGCNKPETASGDVFAGMAKDICMHVAASYPRYTDESAIPAEVIAAEREICRGQVRDKPDRIAEKIVDGKMKKYCEQVCLVRQPFVKAQDMSVGDFLDERGAEAGDTFNVRRFARFQVGEPLSG